MKRIFTFFAAAILSSGAAFGQAKWTSVINNGDLEGDDVSNFYTRDYPTDEAVEEGAGRIIEEPGNEGNHVIVLRVGPEQTSNRYDCQFWIVASEETGQKRC